jgi:hypothetical protein
MLRRHDDGQKSRRERNPSAVLDNIILETAILCNSTLQGEVHRKGEDAPNWIWSD